MYCKPALKHKKTELLHNYFNTEKATGKLLKTQLLKTSKYTEALLNMPFLPSGVCLKELLRK